MVTKSRLHRDFQWAIYPFGGGNMSEQSSHVIAAWLERFSEKSSWYPNEQVCQGVKRSNGLDTCAI